MVDDGDPELAGQSEAVPLVQDFDQHCRNSSPGSDNNKTQIHMPMSSDDQLVVQHNPDVVTASTVSSRPAKHEPNSPMSPQPQGGVRVPPQLRRLKKYASDACFALGTTSGSGGGTSVAGIELIGGPCSSTASETPSPPITVTLGGPRLPHRTAVSGCNQGGPTTYHIREIKNFDPSAAQHPRFFALGPNSVGTAAGTIQRRRQDSDDANGSLGSETTVASGNRGGGVITPLLRAANKRFKIIRPCSTGNMIPAGAPSSTVTGAHYLNNAGEAARSRNVIYDGSGGTVVGGVDSNSVMFFYPDHENNNNNNRSHNKMVSGHGNISNHCPNSNTINNSGNYDPSFTSATIYSLDDSFQQPQADTYSNGVPSAGPGAENERRISNYYLFENDSNHEFDDEINDDFDNVTLMYSKHEKIPMKDFGSEIRATMDIDHLLNKAILLLDLQETSIEEIFAKIIHEMDIQEPEFTSEQVRSVLFTQDSGNQFHILSRTVQSICTTGTISCNYDYDQTWICALCMLNTVQHRHVAIARLSHPTNLGRTMQDLRFIIIVIAPSRAKGTKTALETTRTFATLFSDMDIRQRLVMANSVEAFRTTLLGAAKELALEQSQWRERKASIHLSQAKEQVFGPGSWYPFRGLVEDFMRRKRHYTSDYLDGLRGHRTIQKMFSSVIFLYFACLLPAIAFGVLNDDNTQGGINVRKVIFAQAIGGIFFAIFGGQPMIILLTTVPLAIYIKVIFRISQSLGYDFFAMYTCVGLWCQFFLIIYAATELCNLMKLATRSAEEMFSLFIAIAFTVESIRAIHTSFVHNYNGCDENYTYKPPPSVNTTLLLSTQNYTLFERLINPELRHNITVAENLSFPCHRDTSILYLLLTCGTLWLAMWLYNFRKTPYLTRSRREWLADYALPASVLIMSFTGAYCFSEIDKHMFKLRTEMNLFAIPVFWELPLNAIIVCFLLGFFLSFLFYMDQNITSAIVNNSQNKLKKGSAQHLDLFVVAILNMFLSIMGLPWMHGALPHSPLHIRALADVEERLAQGHVHEVIMNVRETRLASLIAHTLILGSTFFLLPFPLQWIPTSVLHGLFLYMAFTSLTGNEMMERLLLLITEQQAYPPTHYIRRVPQRKVHLFTTCQLIQLVILCAVGFSPYPFVEMVFPIVCFCFLPIRHILIPRLIDYKYLEALDERH